MPWTATLKWSLCTVALFVSLSFQNAVTTSLSEPDPEVVLSHYPKDYFRSPINDNIRLTGTFGELRDDHFHSGIDIKSTTGGVGQPVLATAEGFIDRIKVQAYGYGNAVYVKHPNGYTTLYAHLDRFAPSIEKYVRENQYQKERFEVDLYPADGDIKVNKGEEIGKLGNSGSSSGPHLHFEIRQSATGKVLNPQLFGLPVPDNVPPDVRDMKVYFLNDKREVVSSHAFPFETRADGSIGVVGDTVELAAWRVGFGVKAYDYMSGFRNDNGIAAIQVMHDGNIVYQWRMETLDFDETRYHNAHVDFPVRKSYGAWFHRCFVLPGNRLSNYSGNEQLGAIPLYKEKTGRVIIKIMDAMGNTTKISFWVRRNSNIPTPELPPHQYVLPFNVENRVDLENLSMVMPKGVLYETLYFNYSSSGEVGKNNQFSQLYHIHDNKTPAHRYFDLSIKPQGIPQNLKNKAVIVQKSDGRPDSWGGAWNGEWLTARVRKFGDYCVMIDNEAPQIAPIVFENDMRKKPSMSFRIRDNLATEGFADGLWYRGTIDGKWILFEFDRKNNRLTHRFDARTAIGQHTLRLLVRDDRGNETVFEKPFLR